jgi:DinB superfamily
MVSGPSLQQQLDRKVQEIKQAVSGLSEEEASKKRGEEEWSVKEVLSHLSGDGSTDAASLLDRVVKEDTPQIDIHPGMSYYEGRESIPLRELTSSVESTYSEMGAFLSGLNEEQLNRKAQVPLLKETPIGEYPTLGQLAGALINFHLNDHVQQLRNLSQQQ